MKFDPEIHHRQSNRQKGYDYSSEGAYFVTVCTQDQACLFGEITGGKMVMNDAGRMVETVWDELPEYYPGVDIDVFQIMPNHVHGIVIVGACPRACPNYSQPSANGNTGQPRGVAPTSLSLPDVVHRSKSMTTSPEPRQISDRV